jgi:glycerol 3-phosphatase-2
MRQRVEGSRSGDGPTYTHLIVDLDGTLYRGPAPLPGAIEAMEHLRLDCEVLFLSNNCNVSASHIAERLCRMGFAADAREVVTSVTLMVRAVDQLGSGLRVLTLTSGDVEPALEEAGHRIVGPDRAEVVIVGVDLGISYERTAGALRALLAGAVLIGANADGTYPTEDGPRPGAGAFVGVVCGMGFTPQRMCGKPDPWAMREALALRGFTPGPDCLLVGDRLDSDIAGAHAVGIDSVLVLSGIRGRSEVRGLTKAPTYTVDSIAHVPGLLEKPDWPHRLGDGK